MPGYVIHLAVAEEYMKNHKNQINDYDKFIEGVIYPDDVTNKSITHYGEKTSKVHLKDFVEERVIDNCFEKGHFLHLITDYLFYNKFLEYFSKDIYDDYDKSNEYLIKKYGVKIPANIKNKVFYKKGSTKVFTIESICEFIEKISKYDIENIKEEVLKDNKFWTSIIKLEHR